MVNGCEMNGKLVLSYGSVNEKLITIKPNKSVCNGTPVVENGMNGVNGVNHHHKQSNTLSLPSSPQHMATIDSFTLHSCAVVLSSATINGTIFGVVNSFGVLYLSLIEKFDNPSNSNEFLKPLIGVGSLSVGLIFFCSIFASILTDRFGIQRICFIGGLLSTIGMYMSSLSKLLTHLYITYGVILGIGASLAYGPSLVILGHYFKRRLGLVNGIVTAGSSIFTIVMPFLLKKLIESKGLQSTLEYLSILMSLLMICALTFKENTLLSTSVTDNATKVSDSKKSVFTFNSSLRNNKLYMLWSIAIPVALFGYFVPFVHLVKYANDISNEPNSGEILVMCIGALSGVGRFITGPIADISNVNRIVLQQIAFISIGVLTILLPFAKSFLFLVIICCGLGIFDGCFISLLGPIAFDLVGNQDASQAIGLLLCFCSLPLTVGPPVAAYLYDVYHNYTLAFILAGIPPLIGATLMLYILKIQRQLRVHGYELANGTKPSICANESNHSDLSNHNVSLVTTVTIVNDDDIV